MTSSLLRRSRTALAGATALLLGAGILSAGAVPAAQAAPVGAGFNLNASDLRFVLKQIKIAEEHARTRTASNPCGTLLGTGANQIPNSGTQGVELPWGLRTVDGTCNNLTTGKARLGAADNVFPRRTTAVFRDAEKTPAEFGPQQDTSYKQKTGIVSDSQPRVISNLVVDQTTSNPAAVAAAGGGATPDGSGSLPIPNVAPDVGLSAPYNSVFTLFGQFFDHGLDLTNKSGGTVFMPLQPDDPLYDPNSPTNFMVLTRATNQPGPDGELGTADDIQNATNQTTAFVDQSQTYTSHPSHQVFLREYALDTAARPVSTGALLEGTGGGLATWAAVKAQARTLLGIDLSDQDIFNIPLLETDPYGKFVPGPSGFPQIVLADKTTLEGNPAAPVAVPANAVRTGHAFLDDIAHQAVPFGDHDNNPRTPRQALTPDADTDSTADDRNPGTYDDEMLAAHFIAGDGRINENIGLTAVHQVFHAEHNRLVEDIKSVITNEDPASLPEWQLATSADGWNGERLFQAARFVNEMEYQHLVFEEFARRVQPMVNAFGEGGTGYNTNTNPAIVAEFAHTVYRFGHSMLTETVARNTPTGSAKNISLLDAFLNPPAYNDGGALSPERATGDIMRGMTRQVGNEIDEFVTEALRNELLGLPLDLASLNIARGRDTGVPPLNAARRQFFAASNNSALMPYESWADFSFNLRNPESLVNFIAAYGMHDTITGQSTVAGKRRAAAAIVYGADGADGVPGTAEAPGDDIDPATVPPDRIAFLNSTPHETMNAEGVMVTEHTRWVSTSGGVTTTGVDAIDYWVGGLAEKQMVFGGLLGSTFNFVFEKQMEDLQFGDRFYYLARTAGLNMLTQLEGNSFAELIMRNTDVSGLPADVFSRPDLIIDVAKLGESGAVQDDMETLDYDESRLLTRMPNGTIRYTGPQHAVFNGTPSADRMWSSEGDDTIRGNDGDDWMQGGDGADNLVGGLGDDILNDLFGDDVLKGGDGDDALSSGQGFGGDLNQGGRGNDFVVGGNDITETFAGPGNDFVFAGDADDTVFGDDGDDWIEGGEGAFNLLQGDNGAPFQDDPNTAGHDVIDGDGGEQDFDAEGGDDIMLMGPGIQRAEGMLGFDWSTHKGDPAAADSDMRFTGLLPPSVEALRDRFDLVEALSGWNQDDVLRGDDRDAAAMVDHELRLAGIARVDGLAGLLPPGTSTFDEGNILIGGAGSDTLEGRGGDDVLDGDAWLNVQLRAVSKIGETQLVDSMSQLQADVFAGRIDPGQISIVRSIVTGDAASTDVDTAVFSGPEADYDIVETDGVTTVTHARGTQADGTDTLRGVERLVFADTVGTDTVAPFVATSTPTAGDSDADVTGNVTVTFNEDVRGVSGTTLTLTNAATSAAVPASVSYDADTLTATLDPVAELSSSTTYQVNLLAGITDAGRNPLPPTEWTFTTAAPNPAPTVTVRSPENGATDVAVTSPVTVTFSEEVVDVTSSTFTLRETGGASVVGTVARTANPNQWAFTPTGSLAEGKQFTATLTGGATGIRDTAGAPLATTSWSFTTAAPPADTLRPAVASSTPAANATGVDRTGNIAVTFSEPVTGVSGTTVTLRQGTSTTGTLIGRVVSYDSPTRTATINPNPTLAANTVYTVRLTSGIRDAAGNTLPATTVSFTTAAVPTAPTNVSATAGNGSATVSWTAPSNAAVSNITGYRVQVRTGTTVVRTVSGISGTATSALVSGLTNGTAYNFRVRAVSGTTQGPLSTPSSNVTPTSGTTATRPARPAAPTATAGVSGGAITATAAWTAPADGGSPITGYRVRALRMSSTGSVLETVTSAVQPASARRLEMTLPRTGNYRFTVQAINAVGSSDISPRSNLVAGR